MVALDYLVTTWPEINTVEVYALTLRGIVKAPEKGSRHGYSGVQGVQSFFGYSAWARRFLLILTGSYADECASKIPIVLDSYASIARIDVQSTFRVFRADEFIRKLKRSNRYKATWITPDDGFGVTLYVGSRASNLFCRVYNKSSEMGLPPDADGEFVRVEFCLRDNYADKIWRQYRLGTIEAAFGSLVSRMFEESSALLISNHANVKLSERDLDLLRVDNHDWRERRLRWLEEVVVPSLNRLIADAPYLQGRVWDILDSVARTGYNRE